MKRIASLAKHNAVALLALFVALGGTSYAAVTLPRDSVGTRQLRDGSVTRAKLSLQAGSDVAAVSQINLSGTVLASLSTPRSARTEQWADSPSGEGGIVVYPHAFPRNCAPTITAQSAVGAASSAPPTVSARPLTTNGFSRVQIAASGQTAITVVIACPHGR